MAAQLPAGLAGRSIAVLSYGVRIDQPGTAELLVQPGRAQQIGEIPGVPGLPGLIHDCATREGGAGGPVLDIGTGYAIGVQTHSSQHYGGFAQPTWELARDHHVWDFAIGFRPDPRPSWIASWETVGAKRIPVVIEPPPSNRWTVDEVPIDWSKDEPKAMERLLNMFEPAQALYWAESVGLPLGLVKANSEPKLLWRSLIKNASMCGVLRRLIEEIAREYPGVAPLLRVYL